MSLSIAVSTSAAKACELSSRQQPKTPFGPSGLPHSGMAGRRQPAADGDGVGVGEGLGLGEGDGCGVGETEGEGLGPGVVPLTTSCNDELADAVPLFAESL